MPRFNEIINTFINGEITPRLYGRSDTEVYKRACKKLQNFVTLPQGGVSRRMGTEFITDSVMTLTTSEKIRFNSKSRLIPFSYDEDENYLIIMHADEVENNYYFYFFNTTDRTYGPIVFEGGSSRGWPYDSIGDGSSLSTNNLTGATQVADIHFAQNGSVMFFAHPSMPPFWIRRVAKNTFLAADFYRPFEVVGTGAVYVPTNDRLWQCWPFMDLNVSPITITPSASALGAVTLTASAAIFTTNMVGTPIMITNSGTVGVTFITGYTSTTVVTGTNVRVLPGTSAYTTWALSSWSPQNGYPRTVAFYDGRTVWGGTKQEPERIWFSQLGDIYELSNTNILNPGGTKTAADPGSFSALSTQVNEIQWLSGGNRNLLIGTNGREYSVDNLDGSALSTSVKAQTSTGSEKVQPCIAEDTPIFVQRGFRKLREMLYDYRVEGYSAPEITFLAEHLPRISEDELTSSDVSKIKYLAYQALEHSVVWVTDTNGYLFAATKNRENSVLAFHRHYLGGEYQDGYPFVQSIASVRTPEGTSDDLYLLVRRTINSSDVVYLEKLTKEFYGSTLHHDISTRENMPVYLDCAKIFRPVNANFWARLYSAATATVAGGSTTGTETGTVTYEDGFAEIESTPGYIDYDGTSNADFAQTGCIRFDYAYAGASYPLSLLSISQAAGSNNNLIHLYLSAGGVLNLNIKSSAGADIIAATALGALSTVVNFVPGCFITIELNYELTTGATRVFVNGKQLGSTISSTGTRNTTIDLIRLNATVTGTQSDSGNFKNLLIFNSVQHTADHEVFLHNQASTTVRDLEYLEGEEVSVLADGLYLGEETVASGVITLDASTYTTVIVGKRYTSHLEIMPIDAGTGIGSAQGSIKRIDRAMVRFNRTASASIGTSSSNLEDQVFRLASTPAADPIVLVTDDKVIEFPGDYDRKPTVVVETSDPLPCNVTCIAARGVTYDV